MMPAEFPRLHEVRLSGLTVAFSLGSALLASVVAGLVPALRQARQDAREGLSEDNRVASSSRGTRRLRAGLVVAEVALACLLCIGTTLLTRSAWRLSARDHGFDPRNVLSFSLSLPVVTHGTPEAAARVFGDLTRAFEALPGVRSAGVASNLPWTGYDENTSFDLVGRQAPPGDPPQARFQSASPGFFEALRLRLVSGRAIDARDGARAPAVVVVNEALARRYFPAGDALGQKVDVWGDQREIVGIVADIRDHPADPGAEPAFWWPFDQQPFTSARVVLKAEGDPLAVATAAAAAVRRLDPELPISDVRTVEDIAGEALAERRLALWLFQAFTVLALALAAVAIYGMLAYDVQQRRRELGVRMAMGATRSSVARLVIGHAAWLSAAGIAIALAAAPPAMRVLGALLFGVTASDPASLALAPLLLLAAALAASAVPAWAASRAEVVSALREQ
jgi:predicted permease